MKHISVESLKELLSLESANPAIDFINVCTPAEYKEKHISGVRSVPLDELRHHIREFTGKEKIFVHCRSGKRGEKAIQKLEELGVRAELYNVEGGLLAWENAGFFTKAASNRLPLMRQILIAAGGLILLSHLLFLIVGPGALWLSLGVALGLLIAGVTGWCGMALILTHAPWNK